MQIVIDGSVNSPRVLGMTYMSPLSKLRQAALDQIATDDAIVSVYMDSAAFGLDLGTLNVYRDGTIKQEEPCE